MDGPCTGYISVYSFAQLTFLSYTHCVAGTRLPQAIGFNYSRCMRNHPLIQLMRLDKPIGIWLLLFPACWAVLMARETKPDIGLLLIVFVGAIVMRSAGCIINDLTDRELDASVERTRTRPLVTGAVSKNQAYNVLAVLLGIALLLAAMLPINVLLFSFMAMPMIVAYPWMKRITWWPQAFLGLTFNFGVLIGWAATGASLTWATVFLYLAGIFWTLGYDTIYAMQDAADDATIGIKSTAQRLGASLPTAVGIFYTLMIVCLLTASAIAEMGPLLLVGVAAASWNFRKQLRKLNATTAPDAGALFRSNQWVGLWIFGAMFADRLLISG